MTPLDTARALIVNAVQDKRSPPRKQIAALVCLSGNRLTDWIEDVIVEYVREVYLLPRMDPGDDCEAEPPAEEQEAAHEARVQHRREMSRLRQQRWRERERAKS